MNINDRVKAVRKALNFTQIEFGKKTAIAQTYLSQIEKGDRDVTEKILKIICLVFNVSEEWLRTGAGAMFVKDDNSLIAALSNKYNLDELDRNIIETYIKLSAGQRDVIKTFISTISDNMQGTNVVKAKIEPKRPESSIINVDGKAMLQPIAARSKDDRAAAAREIDDDFLEKFRKAKPITSDDEI